MAANNRPQMKTGKGNPEHQKGQTMTKNILTIIFCMAGSAAICWLCDWNAKAVAWALLFWAVLAVSVAGATLSEQIRAKKNNRR